MNTLNIDTSKYHSGLAVFSIGDALNRGLPILATKLILEILLGQKGGEHIVARQETLLTIFDALDHVEGNNRAVLGQCILSAIKLAENIATLKQIDDIVLPTLMSDRILVCLFRLMGLCQTDTTWLRAAGAVPNGDREFSLDAFYGGACRDILLLAAALTNTCVSSNRSAYPGAFQIAFRVFAACRIAHLGMATSPSAVLFLNHCWRNKRYVSRRKVRPVSLTVKLRSNKLAARRPHWNRLKQQRRRNLLHRKVPIQLAPCIV